MKRFITYAVGSLIIATSTPTHATPYLDSFSWLSAANPGSRQAALPNYSMILQDGFGTYTLDQQNDPVVVGLNGFSQSDPNETVAGRGLATGNYNMAPGMFQGFFGCLQYVGPLCLGAHTITLQFDQKIWGFSGHLNYFGSIASNEIPFFGLEVSDFDSNQWPYYIYSGFFGKIFDTPTDTFTISWRPKEEISEPIGSDAQAFFSLFDVSVLLPGRADGGPPIHVSEPLPLTIFGVAIIGLAILFRRWSKLNRALA